MKHLFSIMACVAIVLCACKDAKTAGDGQYTVEWSLEVLKENGLVADSLCLKDAQGLTIQTIVPESSDTVVVFKGSVDEPQIGRFVLYTQYGGEQVASGIDLVLEPGAITFHSDNGCFAGTPLNDAYCKLVGDVFKAYDAGEDVSQIVRNYVEQHKGDITVPLLLTGDIIFNLMSNAELLDIWEQCTDQQKALPKMQEVKAKFDQQSLTAEGAMFADFQCEYDGKVQKLSDYVGKGKLVLVDFWASWCGPCRAEIPNIKAVWEKHHGDRFEVLGVATWDKPEDTIKAIEEEGVKYPQIINAQQAGSDAYAISGIPEIILFAPDGTILKRGLRGDAIEKAVAEALGE